MSLKLGDEFACEDIYSLLVEVVVCVVSTTVGRYVFVGCYVEGTSEG